MSDDSLALLRVRALEPPAAPKSLGAFGRSIFLGLVVFGVGCLFLPWRQTVKGSGKVVAYSPMERQQSLHAPIPGRIERWFVVEGSEVAEGDPVVEILDVDPGYISRLERRREAEAERITAAQSQAEGFSEQAQAYSQARNLKVQAAKLAVKMAEQKIAGARQKLAAAEAELKTAQANSERTKQLLEKGLVSRRQWEMAELETTKAQATWNFALTEVTEAEAYRTALAADALRADAEGVADVVKSQADVQKAKAEAAYARSDVAKVEVEIARQASRIVRAPMSGTIVRIDGNEGGRIVKGGEELAVLVPETKSRAVELFVDGNDAPLLSKGRKVRLQFEGWPALQFSGWPSVAKGTFGGIVKFVNPAAVDERGRIRVLIQPDPDEPAWPAAAHLRQQVRAIGWVLLDEVSVGWEIWRRVNGFPQSVQRVPDAQTRGASGEAKGSEK